ncbi:glycosyltransferase family 39 protein [Actinoplanes sp. NPDC023801]|uniref:glycosyltransferase family 39 protein n=1 Tax=Actinoplanes sp. NPDC023801 TaxID=3154595 RepID=UPI0033F1C951
MSDTQTRTRPEAVAVTSRAPTPALPSRPRRPDWLVSVLPGLLMLAVGLFRADRPTLSWDEATSAEVSSRTVAQILDLLPHLDAVFGPYYLMLHGWSALAGTSELALRLPSIIAMAAAVATTAELGRRMFTPLTGLTAGLILCLVPNTSRYAAEARPYAFACFFAVLAFLLLVEAVRRGGTKIWIWYGLSVLLLGLSHLLALTTLAAHLALIVLEGRHRARRWAAVAGAAIVPILPIAYLGSTQQDTQLHWVDPITLGRIRAMPAEIAGSREVVWLLIGLAVLAVWRPPPRLVPLVVLAAGPPVVLAVVSALATPMWVARYLLVILAPLAILAAVALTGRGIGRPRHTVARIVAVLLVLAVVAVPGQRAVRLATAKNGPDYRTIAKIIGAEVRPGDVIVYPAKNRAIRAGTDHYLARQPSAPADPLVRVPSARSGWLIAEEHQDAIGHLTGAPRIWLVVGDRRADPISARPELRPLLGTGYRRIGFWQPKRATVALYEKRG